MPQRQREILNECLNEKKRIRNFIRIYPAQGIFLIIIVIGSDVYDQYFESGKTSNRFLYQCLFGKLIFNEGSDPGRILIPPESRENSDKQQKSLAKLGKKQSTEAFSKAKTKEALLITGDDILIEYVKRLSNLVKLVSATNFKQSWRRGILNFINSGMWKKQIDMNQPYIQVFKFIVDFRNY